MVKRNDLIHEEQGISILFSKIVDAQSKVDKFDYDKFDWGEFRYLIELWRFCEKWVKKSGTCRNNTSFFIRIRGFFERIDELKKYNLNNYLAASMLTLFIFVKLCGFENVKDALEFLKENKQWGNIIFGNNIPSEGTVSSFKKKFAVI